MVAETHMGWFRGHSRPHLWNYPQSPWAAEACPGQGYCVPGKWHWFCQVCSKPSFLQSQGIERCHIHIKAPGEPDPGWYRKKKLFTSTQIQAVCGHWARGLDICVGFSGSEHETPETPEDHPEETWILKISVLMVSWQPTSSQTEISTTNRYHSKACVIAEWAFNVINTNSRPTKGVNILRRIDVPLKCRYRTALWRKASSQVSSQGQDSYISVETFSYINTVHKRSTCSLLLNGNVWRAHHYILCGRQPDLISII